MRKKNYSFIDLPEFESGQIVEGYNLQRIYHNTPIGDGTQIYKKCNIVNCDVQGAQTVDCFPVQKDRCYWLWAKFDNDGNEIENRLGLPVEDENCRHVIDVIEVDDNVIGYVREDTIL